MEQKDIISKILEKKMLPTRQLVNLLLENPDKIDEFPENPSLFSNNNNNDNNINTSKKETETKICPDCFTELKSTYVDDFKKKEIDDFVMYFNKRYEALRKVLMNRQDLQDSTSISKIRNKKDREKVSLIGMVYEVGETKNKNIIMELEDPTGSIKIVINKSKEDIFTEAKEIAPDEIIGVNGTISGNIIFANKIIFPDIPMTKELKKSPEEEYAIFLSDVHVGSNFFMKKEFEKFIEWINGNVGNDEQKRIASKVKYIFIAGDIVDGIGIYPGQEEELYLKDITSQYNEAADYIAKIDKSKKIIICAGNHDAVRISEPQPKIYEDFASKFYTMSNVLMVPNPSVITMAKKGDFSGFDVLLYHGYSFDHYVANVDSIRNQGGYDRADLIMKFLLKKRHLAPSHTSTLYIPDSRKDNLVIDQIPDFFVSGHIHKASVSTYRNITMISGSCWQETTPFQQKVGHTPEPARVPIVNLQTREVKMLKFGK